MTPEMLDLARRAVACKGWRWMPGMLAVEQAVPGMALSARPVRVDDYWHEVGVWLPDLTDPATVGCLLALVREAWGQEDMGAVRIFRDGLRKWCVEHDEDDAQAGAFYGPTEADALVEALEAAP